MQRRSFIQQVAALAGCGLIGSQCGTSGQRTIPGTIVGASATVGHLLRDGIHPGPTQETFYTDVVIVGGGISGLSAARWLQQHGVANFMVLDLEKHTGGNSSSGANNVCNYPWGAHYVPIPNNDLDEYLHFLQECGVIVGHQLQPVYNDLYLCFAPEERLYINGLWQEGLVPHAGVPPSERQQIKRFLEQMDHYRYARGKDGKDAFAIPISKSSRDEQYVQLDLLTMKAWLLQNDYTSRYLHWYCNYCTRDDFGTRYDEVSAWAGIHYFAGRKGQAANASSHDVLTWPQGNGFLVEQLQKNYTEHIKVNTLVTSVEEHGKKVIVTCLNTNTRQWQKIIARKCIIAAPQFVAQRLVKRLPPRFSYSPWMVANITTKPLEERQGEGLCWDNVIYGAESLGYVEATHQLLQQQVPEKVLTYYLPLTKWDPATERKAALTLKHKDWVHLIFQELKRVHPNIEEAVQHIDVMIWGHAMIQPRLNTIHGRTAIEPMNNAIFFAHTDLAGISIFEEGFYQGINAAKAVLKALQ